MVKKVLIAEDEASISHALEDKLSSAGFSVKVVPNGHDVLELLKTETFDVLLLDLIMPRLDGFNTMQEIKKQNLPIKVAVLSNLGQEEDIKKVKELGVLDYFVKSETPLSEIVNYLKQL
ncbi:MAG: response regulator [Parcubacteria group bacterium]|nr:MAG: response regulator [Parcubacteria group bacterium]